MLITFFSIFYLSKKYTKNNYLPVTICIWSVLLFFCTEYLSLLNGLNRSGVTTYWVILAIAGMIMSFLEWSKNRPNRKKKIEFAQLLKNHDIILIIWIIMMGYLAWNIVPSNWDSMTYHMARVANWIQNGTVDYYTTNIPRQLYSPVFAEYVILNLQLILGSDIAANMVQWAAYALSAYLLFDIGGKLKYSYAVRYLIVTMYLTMPMAIAQSVSTQVDHVGGLWLFVFIDLCLDLVRVEHLSFEKNNKILLVMCAIAVSFGYLSKSTVCIAMLVFLVWLFISCLKRHDKWKIILIYICVAGTIVLAFSLPTFIRNYGYTGDIIAFDYMEDIAVGSFMPNLLFVNMYKNWAVLSLNALMRDAIVQGGVNFASLLGVDINDAAISMTGDFYNHVQASYHMDYASCCIPALLFIVLLIVYIELLIVKMHTKENAGFAVTCMLAVFSGLFAIRFQVWGSRLLLPYAALMCIFDGHVIDDIFRSLGEKYINTETGLLFVCELIMIFTALPAVSYQARYMIHYIEAENRSDMYFENRKEEQAPYNDLCNFVKNAGMTKIGLYLGTDTFEYPLWVMLKNENTRMIQVVHEKEEDTKEIPDCIIAIHREKITTGMSMEYKGREYTCVYDYGGKGEYAVLMLN